jgi:hypothetical protein
MLPSWMGAESPYVASQLVDRWLDPFATDPFEYRIEGDWSGTHRVMAASAVTKLPQGAFALSAGAESLRSFIVRQRDSPRTR